MKKISVQGYMGTQQDKELLFPLTLNLGKHSINTYLCKIGGTTYRLYDKRTRRQLLKFTTRKRLDHKIYAECVNKLDSIIKQKAVSHDMTYEEVQDKLYTMLNDEPMPEWMRE